MDRARYLINANSESCHLMAHTMCRTSMDLEIMSGQRYVGAESTRFRSIRAYSSCRFVCVPIEWR